MRRVVGLLLLTSLVLAGCGNNASRIGDVPGPSGPSTPGLSELDGNMELSGFVDDSAMKLFSPHERSASTKAQFYALQFGRTGAPRMWTGDRGASGEVVVGPPVMVNSLYCRNFTHKVSVGGQSFVTNGTACRDDKGLWSAVI
jgi:surface antigen